MSHIRSCVRFRQLAYISSPTISYLSYGLKKCDIPFIYKKAVTLDQPAFPHAVTQATKLKDCYEFLHITRYMLQIFNIHGQRSISLY